MPPQVSSPPKADDPEVSSQRASLDSGEVRRTTNAAPEAAEDMAGATPMETGRGGPWSSDPQSDVVPETHTIPELDQKLTLEEGRMATSTHTEA